MEQQPTPNNGPIDGYRDEESLDDNQDPDEAEKTPEDKLKEANIEREKMRDWLREIRNRLGSGVSTYEVINLINEVLGYYTPGEYILREESDAKIEGMTDAHKQGVSNFIKFMRKALDEQNYLVAYKLLQNLEKSLGLDKMPGM